MVQWLATKAGRFTHRVFHRLLSPNAELQELTYLTYAFVWGLILFFFPRSLESSLVYSKMSALAHENMWGGLLFLYGLLGYWAYWIDDHRVRRVVSMCGVMLWTLISYFLFVDFHPAIGTVAVPLCAVMSVLTYLRLGGRA